MMSSKDSKTIGDTIEKTKKYHEWYLRAVNNPLRRKILRALKERSKTIHELQSMMSIDLNTLSWNLDILEYGFCVKKESDGEKVVYRITQEGEVVDFFERSKK